jgi:hypothetical protein
VASRTGTPVARTVLACERSIVNAAEPPVTFRPVTAHLLLPGLLFVHQSRRPDGGVPRGGNPEADPRPARRRLRSLPSGSATRPWVAGCGPALSGGSDERRLRDE